MPEPQITKPEVLIARPAQHAPIRAIDTFYAQIPNPTSKESIKLTPEQMTALLGRVS